MRTILVDGYRRPMTAAEEAERDAEEAAEAAALPMRQWLNDIAATDAKMARPVEDVIDWMIDAGIELAKAPQYLMDAHAAKKAVRARKP